MTKPKLPSELHPDYPEGKYLTPCSYSGCPIFKPASADKYIQFYQAHPEFENEGEYQFICPYCGGENHYVDQGGWCCSEVGHCEWVYVEGEES